MVSDAPAGSHCAAGELVDDGVAITTIHMPLIRTEMIAPTRIYDASPTLTPDQAADLVYDAVIDRPEAVAFAHMIPGVHG